MSYKVQEIIFNVSDVQIGIPVGFELECAGTTSFSPILYRLTTFDEITASPNTFFYSLNNGTTWIDFPLGESGKAFYAPYQMKVLINQADISYIFAEKQGNIYRVSGDGKTLIDSYTISSFNSSGFEIDSNNNLYITGQNKTAYKIDSFVMGTGNNNSLNIHSNPIGIAVDGTRKTLWQVDRNKIHLKDLMGNTIFEINLPFEIDVDYSSSSSSGSSLSSSSSSTEIRSTSSSSSSSP